MQDAGGRTIDNKDLTNVWFEAIWILILAVPFAIAWRNGWTFVFWLCAALLVLSVIFVIQAFVDHSSKWKTSVEFTQWPVALGSELNPTLRIEAIKSTPADQPIEVRVRVVCEEHYRRRASSSNDHDHGDRETEVVVELEETYFADLRDGRASLPLELRLPIDKGAPSQHVRVDGAEFIVEWSMSVVVDPFGSKAMDSELEVGAVVEAVDAR